mgnify:CR=1 FL=1
MEQQVTDNKIQNLVVENRSKLSVTGVTDILSFDDQIVIIDTNMGMLTVKGIDLRINKLNIDTNDIIVEGTINSLTYSEKIDKKASNIIGKIFK